MQLQRQHFLFSYFETLSVGLAGVELITSRRSGPMLNQLSHRLAAAAVKPFVESA